MRTIPLVAIFIFFLAGSTFAQAEHEAAAEAGAKPPEIIELQVPAGTPLPVVLDREVRIKKVGQAIHAKIAEPVFAFDKLVVPAGSEVTGSVTRIGGVSAMKRTMAALDTNFSPTRDIEITFDQLVLPGGQQIPLHTHVAPASQGVLQFATAPEPKNEGKGKKQNAAVKLASEKISQKKQEINKDWETAKQQNCTRPEITSPEKTGDLRLPIHPQYIDAGTRFNAELLDPLNFGAESLTSEKLLAVGTPPAAGSIVHALLKTALSSDTAQRGEAVRSGP